MINISIIGASGYTGGELLRILLAHPEIKVLQVTSNRFIGEPVSLYHPNLRGRTSLTFSSVEELQHCDVMFVALPNGISMTLMADLVHRAHKIIDLGADFRLRDEKTWYRWYGKPHTATHLIDKFIYGLPELHRAKIKKASFIAGPGCEAAVTILCLWPLVKHNLIEEKPIIVDAKMSSSQAGSRATLSSHHPERAGVVRSYMPTGHRHTAEIEQELQLNGISPQVAISATAIELVRGLLVTIHTFLKNGLNERDIWNAYRTEYGDEPFIRIIKQKDGLYRYPEPKILQGTNFCDIGFEIDKHTGRLVIIGAIDNLVKGTAGNAIQCMNLMSNFPETLGLEFSGLHPI